MPSYPRTDRTVPVTNPLTTVSREAPPCPLIIKWDPLKATNNTTELQAKYGPNFFYQDIESGKYCFNCEKRHQNVCVHKVVVGLKRGTTFIAHVNNKRCHTLVDTGASHLCMSLAFYEQLSLYPVQKLVGTTVLSMTGSNFRAIGHHGM